YSADSFLDIICNLVYKYVGIVLIVLVLVAKQASLWPNLNSLRIGPLPPEEPQVAEEIRLTPPPVATNLEISKPQLPMADLEDKIHPEAQSYEREIAQLRTRLLEQLRTMEVGKKEARQVQEQQVAVNEQKTAVRSRLATHDQQVASIQAAADAVQSDARPLRT